MNLSMNECHMLFMCLVHIDLIKVNHDKKIHFRDVKHKRT